MLKLLKYELLQSYRNYSLIFVIFLGLCFLNPFLVNVGGISMILQISLIIMIVVIYVLIFYNIIKNYSESMFSEKGYLTLTLPVSTHKLVLSKVLATFIWFIIANIILLIGAIITIALLVDSSAIMEVLRAIGDGILEILKYIITYEGFLMFCVSIASMIVLILEIYMFITLVQTKYTRNNKKIMAIILFVIYESVIGYITADIRVFVPSNLYLIFGYSGMGYSLVNSLYFNLGYYLIFGLLYYFVIIYIIDNKIEI